MAEIDVLLGDAVPGSRPGRCSAEVAVGPAVTNAGLLDGERTQMVFTDSP